MSPSSPELLRIVDRAARATSRPARALLLQALLQLPRIADAEGVADAADAESLVLALADELPHWNEWFVSDAGLSPRRLDFHEVEERIAQDVTRRFHYLRSARTDGRAYGLHTRNGEIVALCVCSPLDVPRIRELQMMRGRDVMRASVVSRVFAFENSPRNSISFLLSRVVRSERAAGATDLVTYVNPNLGFTGSSYLASGWELLGNEPGTTYRYLDGRYVTDRVLVRGFGRHDDSEYRAVLGPRFAVSVMFLEPLLVFRTDDD